MIETRTIHSARLDAHIEVDIYPTRAGTGFLAAATHGGTFTVAPAPTADAAAEAWALADSRRGATRPGRRTQSCHYCGLPAPSGECAECGSVPAELGLLGL